MLGSLTALAVASSSSTPSSKPELTRQNGVLHAVGYRDCDLCHRAVAFDPESPPVCRSCPRINHARRPSFVCRSCRVKCDCLNSSEAPCIGWFCTACKADVGPNKLVCLALRNGVKKATVHCEYCTQVCPKCEEYVCHSILTNTGCCECGELFCRRDCGFECECGLPGGPHMVCNDCSVLHASKAVAVVHSVVNNIMTRGKKRKAETHEPLTSDSTDNDQQHSEREEDDQGKESGEVDDDE